MTSSKSSTRVNRNYTSIPEFVMIHFRMQRFRLLSYASSKDEEHEQKCIFHHSTTNFYILVIFHTIFTLILSEINLKFKYQRP